MDVKDSSFLDKIREYEKTHLDAERYAHCERVGQTARLLCRKFGIDEDVGYSAGLAHDMCKNMEPAVMLTLAAADGYPVSEEEKNKPSLLHGRAAAVLLRNTFKVTDEDYLEAVAWHTYGKKSLSVLGKIIYTADKFEPGRKYITKEFYDEMLSLPLDELCIRIIKYCMDFLEKKGAKPAAESLEFLEELESGRKN